jgi:hypothetical protein
MPCPAACILDPGRKQARTGLRADLADGFMAKTGPDLTLP